MRDVEAVIVHVFDPLVLQQCVDLRRVASAVGSGHGFSPIPFSRHDKAGLLLEVRLLPGNQQIGSPGIKSFGGPVDGRHAVVQPVEEHGGIPRSGIPIELRILQNQAQRPPAALAETKEEPAFRRARRRIAPFNERNDKLLQITGLPGPGIGGMISKPGLLLESHLHNDDIVSVVGLHLPEHAQTVAVLPVKASLDGKHIQDTVGLVFAVAVRQEDTNLLPAVLVLRLNRMDLHALLHPDRRCLRIGRPGARPHRPN